MKAATYKDLQNNLDHYVEDVVDNQELTKSLATAAA